MATATPSSDIGPDPRNIQNVRRAWTVPSRRCLTAPKLLKIAPWRMSVPTASVGLKPKKMTRIGVSSEPPPMPVTPDERADQEAAEGELPGHSLGR